MYYANFLLIVFVSFCVSQVSYASVKLFPSNSMLTVNNKKITFIAKNQSAAKAYAKISLNLLACDNVKQHTCSKIQKQKLRGWIKKSLSVSSRKFILAPRQQKLIKLYLRKALPNQSFVMSISADNMALKGISKTREIVSSENPAIKFKINYVISYVSRIFVVPESIKKVLPLTYQVSNNKLMLKNSKLNPIIFCLISQPDCKGSKCMRSFSGYIASGEEKTFKFNPKVKFAASYYDVFSRKYVNIMK